MANIVQNILSSYEKGSLSNNKEALLNMKRLLEHGKLGNTGKLLILPVDQGFEHGPEKSFLTNPYAYDPDYLYSLAVEGGFSAFAAPLGIISHNYTKYQKKIPTILKMNSSYSLTNAKQKQNPSSAITATVNDAVRLGCIGVGFTIYPGSESFHDSISDLSKIIQEARSKGLLIIIWSYPRGSYFIEEAKKIISKVEQYLKDLKNTIKKTDISSDDFYDNFAYYIEAKPHILSHKELSLFLELKNNASFMSKIFVQDKIVMIDELEKILANNILPNTIDHACYAAHIASLLDADIIKIKMPNTAYYKQDINIPSDILNKYINDWGNKADRVKHILRSSFNGKKLILFSGGEKSDVTDILSDVNAIKEGGGTGSIIGRNIFQREKDDSLVLIEKIIKIYNP